MYHTHQKHNLVLDAMSDLDSLDMTGYVQIQRDMKPNSNDASNITSISGANTEINVAFTTRHD